MAANNTSRPLTAVGLLLFDASLSAKQGQLQCLPNDLYFDFIKMVAVDPKAKDKLDILIIADNFNPNLKPLTGQKPLGLFEVASVTLLDLTLEWISRIDANVYVAISSVENAIAAEIKNKWKPYVNVEILKLKGCHSFGDVVRAVDKLHLFTKEFVLIENVPTFCSSRLHANLDAFKALRKDKTTNGKTILGKDNLMSMLCTRTAVNKNANLVMIEKGTNRLLLYNPDKDGIALTKRQFTTGCIVRSDLKQAGIYFCAPEVITKFTDNVDAQTFNEQIGNIVAQDETICEYIYVDILSDTVFADTADDYDSLYDCLYSFLHQKYYPSTFGSLHPNITNWEQSYALQYRENFVFTPQHYNAPLNSNNSVFGGAFKVGEHAMITGCFFDDNLIVGAKSKLSRVIAGKNVKVGRDVRLSHVIIAENVHIDDGIELQNCLILADGQQIPLQSGGPPKPTIRRSKSRSSISEALSEVALGGLNAFRTEIRETFKNLLAADDWDDSERLNSLILEINSSRLAYNISIDDLAKFTFAEFMEQPRFGPTLNDMRKLTEGVRPVWRNFYKSDNAKLQILHAIEEHVQDKEEWAKYAANYVLYLYNDLDMFSDDIILDWFGGLATENALRKNDAFTKLINWLREEDSDDDD